MTTILDINGKQYKVNEGEKIKVDKINGKIGETITLDKILVVSKDAKTKLGQPFVKGANVTAKILKHGKDKKVLVFKYKPKKNYRVKSGHRQEYTLLKIEKIKQTARKTTAQKEERESA